MKLTLFDLNPAQTKRYKQVNSPTTADLCNDRTELVCRQQFTPCLIAC